MGEQLKWASALTLGVLLAPLVLAGVILALLCYGLALGVTGLAALATPRK